MIHQPIPDPTAKRNTLVILDWDDTICPTTWARQNNIDSFIPLECNYNYDEESISQISHLSNAAKEFLETLISLHTIDYENILNENEELIDTEKLNETKLDIKDITENENNYNKRTKTKTKTKTNRVQIAIVTNAHDRWLSTTSQNWLPEIVPLLSHIFVCSARAKYEARCKGSTLNLGMGIVFDGFNYITAEETMQWKLHAFTDLLHNKIIGEEDNYNTREFYKSKIGSNKGTSNTNNTNNLIGKTNLLDTNENENESVAVSSISCSDDMLTGGPIKILGEIKYLNNNNINNINILDNQKQESIEYTNQEQNLNRREMEGEGEPNKNNKNKSDTNSDIEHKQQHEEDSYIRSWDCVISIGDSFHEREALWKMCIDDHRSPADRYTQKQNKPVNKNNNINNNINITQMLSPSTNCLFKSVKLGVQPGLQDMTNQLKLLTRSIHNIIEDENLIDIELQ